eukprot:403335282
MITRKGGKAKAQKPGEDTFGNQYGSIDEMWKRELKPDPVELQNEELKIEGRVGDQDSWYKKQVEYWNQQEATVDGVLGGYGKVHPVDADTSCNFLDSFKTKIGHVRALDCGAGIGRVTKSVLLDRFDFIDLVEPSQVQLDKAREYIGSDKVQNLYCKGLQEFEFEHKYDVIWLQWVLCYLTDDDLVQFLKKCGENLTDENSLIFVKENVHESSFYVDKDDNSVVRSDQIFQDIFEQAGFIVVKHVYQQGFPKELFRISLYALKKA